MGATERNSVPSRAAAVVARLARPVLLAAMLLGGHPALAATAPPASAGGGAATVVPDRFLRRWDPLTVFFAAPTGPAAGAEDRPGRFVTLSPPHPGAWSWIDARTLQFRPAEPWPSLTSFSIAAGGRTTTLVTLLAAPTASNPPDGAEGLDPVDEISLTFPEPLEPAALARSLSVELRPLPGLPDAGAPRGDGGRRLGADDFSLKAMPRRSRSDDATYVLALRTPIPFGTRATVHLRLAPGESDDESFRRISFSTAQPFRIAAAGCRERQLPIPPDGSRYGREQALSCGGRELAVELTAQPREVGPVEAKNLLRLSPTVPGLEARVEGRTIVFSGPFAAGSLYRVNLAPAPLSDRQGRPLEVRGAPEFWVSFAPKPAFVRWGASQGIAERFGPQQVPIEGRGQERIDLRIHPVDPLDRSTWPFPEGGFVADEADRPPSPGEEPPPFADATRSIAPHELERQLRLLGSPPVSALVTLPLRRDGGAATFGFDLAPHLAKVAGKGAPGHYLVGLRDLANDRQRHWMRLQVTDLCLSTAEEPRAVVFAVTSLSTGQPVAGATVRLDGTVWTHDTARWETLFEGRTDGEGRLRWTAPGGDPTGRVRKVLRRIVVSSGKDLLVLDPSRPPDRFADNQWSIERDGWFQWAFEELDGRGAPVETLAHLYSDRPVYRPGETVHLAGWIRTRAKGDLAPARPDGAALVVDGPGGVSWRLPVTPTSLGGFAADFTEAAPPTGVYSARLEDRQRSSWGSVSFRIEAYRIPKFEVRLHGPERAPLDEPFRVDLTASWYAGGKVAGQPVAFRVTQFPYDWSPPDRPELAGFLFSSDGRFSRTARFESTPRLEREETTSESGAASISLDPTVEPTAQPRTYVVEATVTGDDDQAVTAVRRFVALPPFLLGLRAPRFVEDAAQIEPELVVLGADGRPVAGRGVSVRLIRREWHSHLRASDFADGVARYVTDVVDEPVSESRATSGAGPVKIPLAIPKAGVYIVEVSARDRLGRTQVVRVDLWAGGREPVAWPRPATKVFEVTTDRDRYEPGETASLVLRSPFQKGRALAVVEAPEGNEYSWIDVDGGAATFRLPVRATMTPRVPVHFVLMRGRVAGTSPAAGNAVDLGRPTTLAATAWLEVAPTGNRVEVTLDHPASARPGGRFDLEVRLADPKGRPLSGEVTVWLVDAAVLALGREGRLDPLPDFITPVSSHLALRDSRNLAFGEIPFADSPGGDGGDGDGRDLLDRATVRKNFQPVPFWKANVPVGPDGRVVLPVDLPDDLTVFKVRAKAAAGPNRFGAAGGEIAVRLPVVVQPVLPRFVRPGDRVEAGALGRVVEGAGGPAVAQARITGARLDGAAKRDLTLGLSRAERIDLPFVVDTPAARDPAAAGGAEIVVKVGVERTADRAADAFEVRLPVRADREEEVRRELVDLAAGKPAQFPPLPGTPRPGSVRREVLVSDRPDLVRMAAALDLLLAYPHGCTEQRTSRSRALVALRRFRQALELPADEKRIAKEVADTLSWISDSFDPDGLVAFWPGSPGTVTMTAWSLSLVTEAKGAGLPVDEKLRAKLLGSLERSLRSDAGRFVDGASYTERAWALAALADAGRFDPAYATELARRGRQLDVEGASQVLSALGRGKAARPEATGELLARLDDAVVTRLHQGKEVWAGFGRTALPGNRLILPGETRALAEMIRALGRVEPSHRRLPLLESALVSLGGDRGWGSTNADASALLALAERLDPAFATTAPRQVDLAAGAKGSKLSLGPGRPIASVVTAEPGALSLSAGAGGPLVARVESRWLPSEDGSRAEPLAAGFVVSREAHRLRPGGEPPEKLRLDAPGTTVRLSLGDIVEERVRVVIPEERYYVAIVLPLAAGLEPLDPALATAPPEARPSIRPTLEPTFRRVLDDQVAWYYDRIPAGSYELAIRTRASTAGSFVQPPARAEAMYDEALRGRSAGARVEVAREPR